MWLRYGLQLPLPFHFTFTHYAVAMPYHRFTFPPFCLRVLFSIPMNSYVCQFYLAINVSNSLDNWTIILSRHAHMCRCNFMYNAFLYVLSVYLMACGFTFHPAYPLFMTPRHTYIHMNKIYNKYTNTACRFQLMHKNIWEKG